MLKKILMLFALVMFLAACGGVTPTPDPDPDPDPDPAPTISVAGSWRMVVTVTETPEGREEERGRKFTFEMDLNDGEGVLTGPAFIIFGGGRNDYGSVTGTRSERNLTLRMNETVAEGETERYYDIVATLNEDQDAFMGTYVNVFNFKGTVTAEKLDE